MAEQPPPIWKFPPFWGEFADPYLEETDLEVLCRPTTRSSHIVPSSILQSEPDRPSIRSTRTCCLFLFCSNSSQCRDQSQQTAIIYSVLNDSSHHPPAFPPPRFCTVQNSTDFAKQKVDWFLHLWATSRNFHCDSCFSNDSHTTCTISPM